MNGEHHRRVLDMRFCLWAVVTTMAVSITVGCGGEAPPMGSSIDNRDSAAVMVSYGVSKLISDSGVFRYKVVAEEWRVYDKTVPPRWEFPKGIFLERFDDKFKVNLHITADTAWLFDQNLWKLHSHVVLHDESAQTRVYTDELYWNMNTGELSSNVYSHLIKPDQEIEGDWFRARLVDGQLTQYHIRQSKGFMPKHDYGEPEPLLEDEADDSLEVDTLVLRGGPMSRPRTN